MNVCVKTKSEKTRKHPEPSNCITLTHQHLSSTPMTSPKQADAALNNTFEDVQSLIKRCMKLKEGDSVTGLALSDEIARRVAKDLKLYGGSATSFSPQLLSCAVVVWQYLKGGMFESLPDWMTVSDNDPHIKNHPHFHKTIHYGAPTGSGNTDPEPAPVQMDVQATVSSFWTLDSPEGNHMADIQGAATTKLLPSMLKPHHGISSTTFNTMGLQSSPLMGTKALEPLTPLPSSIAVVMEHHIVTGGASTPEKIVMTGDAQMRAKTLQ
ncbi:hypothetical protein EV424DRAFT_1353850 [Suillus variegatus]|nr:hypothetical protein EV424DRAFT_1353850 [Suillus variegatus]